METNKYVPHDISPDGHFGVVATGFPDGLPQETVVYFPNGYQAEKPIEKIEEQGQTI